MEDNKSLISERSGKNVLWKQRNVILPICGLLVFLACLLFIFSALLGGGKMSAQLSCGRGWKEFNQSCYKLAMDYHNMEECRRECKEGGGDLASVHSVEENNLIISLLKDRPEREGKKSTWIAGSITERDGHFRWMDGTDWDFENWDQGRTGKIDNIHRNQCFCRGT